MRKLRIVFMGTPEFAVTILKGILEAGYEVAGVITAPDKPAGRGRKIQESAVKQFAISNNLKVLQPTNLKSPEFLTQLSSLNANIQVVVAFRMLPKEVWQLPEFGTFNLHASLLPDYRGAAPINWAIINGEKITGVSTFFIDEKIDTGEMILQKKVNIEDIDNAGTLHDKLMNEGAYLVVETLEKLKEGKITTTKQPQDQNLKEAPKLNRKNTKIDWAAPIEDIYNLIRGLDPYPAAWSNLLNGEETLTVKFFEVEMIKEENKLPIGELLIKDRILKVSVNNGFIKILEIQLPGKRKLKTRDLLNGFEFEKNAKVL